MSRFVSPQASLFNAFMLGQMSMSLTVLLVLAVDQEVVFRVQGLSVHKLLSDTYWTSVTTAHKVTFTEGALPSHFLKVMLALLLAELTELALPW